MMMTWLPVLGAFACVVGLLTFLAWCGEQFDAEQKQVDDYRSS